MEKMADLLNSGEDKPKRTRVFVNHVDLYTGKNISKVEEKYSPVKNNSNMGIKAHNFGLLLEVSTSRSLYAMLRLCDLSSINCLKLGVLQCVFLFVFIFIR